MKNFSIIKSIEVALLRNCKLPDYKFSTIARENILRPGYRFINIPGIKKESSSFVETEKESEGGFYFEKSVKLDISKLRPEVSSLLDQVSNNKLVAVITDGNNISHLVFPVKRIIKRTIPGTVKKANVTSIEFSGKSMYESPIVY